MNYQKELDRLLERLKSEERVPRLLLHSCCAPCSSYVLEYLNRYFEITVFYYNPNIYPESEYTKRIWEQQELISRMPFLHPVSFLAGPYDQERFYEMARGLEHVKEGESAALSVTSCGFQKRPGWRLKTEADYFTTTLSISPLKNADRLNEIGMRLGEEYGVPYLPSDFKKKNGYKRSIDLSREYDLYRQDYCGCEFSMNQRRR